MFVGHYAAAFALKAKEKNASLGMLFIAVQFVDILFFPFVVIGIERLKFVPGFTEVNNFDLEYYPFTHGLLGSLFWAALFYVVYRFVVVRKHPTRNKIAWMMALGVLSHWFADLIVHTPDLPLVSGTPKFGFGLWKSKVLTFAVEAFLLGLSAFYYLWHTQAKSAFGKYPVVIFTG